MTNAEAIIKGLENIYECDDVANYIDCPYVHNLDCQYDGGNDHGCCMDCKMEWLEKEWENQHLGKEKGRENL